MTFKTRVTLSFGLFIVLVASLGAGLMINSLREEKAFRLGRNALRSQFMSQEIDYFMSKKFRAVETFVMLQEELEKTVIDETDRVLQKKFEVWEQWVKTGDASAQELAEIKEVYAAARTAEGKILALMDEGSKEGAMRLVGTDFRPLSKKALAKLKELTTKKADDAAQAEATMQRVVRQGHMTSVAGVLLSLVLGIVLAMSLYNSVQLPMKVLTAWSEQIAKGHLHVSLNLPGDSEMGRVASNFNEMMQTLAFQHHDQVERERARMVLEREQERALDRERSAEEARSKKKKEEQEEVSTLEDAVDGFREILDIMGSAAPTPREKKKG
jgi:methyl-accepting chemotaxis protein